MSATSSPRSVSGTEPRRSCSPSITASCGRAADPADTPRRAAAPTPSDPAVPDAAGGRDDIRQRLPDLVGLPRLQPAVRVDPQPFRRKRIDRRVEEILDLVSPRYPRGVDVVDTRAHIVAETR